MPEPTFENLRVRAYLAAPVISDEYLPLDGVVFYTLARKDFGEQVATFPGQKAEMPDGVKRTPMPFERRRSPDYNRRQGRRLWWWACSFAQWPAHTVEGKDHWNKRFDERYADLVDFGEGRGGKPKRGVVVTKSGKYKAYHQPVFYRHALYVEWYCVGDRAALEALLPFCTHLGKKAAQGWGDVLRWEVAAWPEDWSERGPGGRLMRALPVGPGEEGTRFSIRPSYWNPHHAFPCKLPRGHAA